MTTDLMSIRKATGRDALVLADIYADAWRASYQGILPALDLERAIVRRGPKWWRRATSQGNPVLILEFDDVPAGYVSFGPNRNRSLPFDGEIMELYLTPVYQGLGFGSQLFDRARQDLLRHGLKGLIVWCLSDNDRACDFYTNKGGRPVALAHERFGKARLRKMAFGWSAS